MLYARARSVSKKDDNLMNSIVK